MSYTNDPNDPNYVAPGTVPPVVEAVEPAGSNLKWLWWLLGLLALGALIWGLTRACGTREETVVTAPVETPAATAPAEVTTPPATPETLPAAVGQCADITGTVNFRWWGGDGRAALQNEAIEAFNALYPNITVNVQPQAFAGYWDQLQIEAIAGNTPDLFTTNEAWLSTLINGGVLADLRDIDTVDLSHFTNDALGAAVSGNHVYAIPTGANAASIIVNLDILEEAGIEVPNDQTWSWDEFLDIATQVSNANLTNANGESVFGVSHLGGQQVARVWANQTDGGMFTPTGELNWSEESMEEYLAFLQELIASGAAPSAAIQQEFGPVGGPGESLMAQGRAAFQPQWSNQLGAVNPLGNNVSLLRFPGDSTSANMGTWINPSMFFAVSSNAQNPEAAGCLLDFMVNNEEAAQIMGIDRGIPLNEAMFAVVEPGLTGNGEIEAAFIDRISANGAASIPVPELSDDLNNILIISTDTAIFNQQTAAQSAANLQSNLDAARVG